MYNYVTETRRACSVSAFWNFVRYPSINGRISAMAVTYVTLSLLCILLAPLWQQSNHGMTQALKPLVWAGKVARRRPPSKSQQCRWIPNWHISEKCTVKSQWHCRAVLWWRCNYLWQVAAAAVSLSSSVLLITRLRCRSNWTYTQYDATGTDKNPDMTERSRNDPTETNNDVLKSNRSSPKAYYRSLYRQLVATADAYSCRQQPVVNMSREDRCLNCVTYHATCDGCLSFLNKVSWFFQAENRIWLSRDQHSLVKIFVARLP